MDLVGITPGSPMIACLAIHGTYMSNDYDFYKPSLSSEYPIVDGPGSITTYLKALDHCYERFRTKSARSPTSTPGNAQGLLSLDDFDYHIFHAPYGKLVQKGYARLASP